MLDGVGGIRFLSNLEVTLLVSTEPCPTRPEQGRTSLGEYILEVLKRAELLINGLSQAARRGIIRLGSLELGEVQVVVQNLTCIVQHTALCLKHHLLERLALKPAARQCGIEIVDIGSQVLAVMKPQRSGANHRLQRIRRVRQSH